MSTAPMDERELREKLAQYRFYHVIPLTPTISTPGNPDYQRTTEMILGELHRTDLTAKRFLDVGCRDGLFSFEAEKRGAAEVVGIDNDLSKPAIELLIPYLRSRVQMIEMNLYDLDPAKLGRFDVILCAGVLYHLRFPFWGLRVLREALADGGTLILETAIWQGMEDVALLHCPVGDESPFEPTSCSFFNEKGLRDTLGSLGFEVVRTVYRPKPSIAQPAARRWRKRGERILYRLARRFGLAPREWDVRIGRKRQIERSVWVCRLAARTSEGETGRYWEGTHGIHTRVGG